MHDLVLRGRGLTIRFGGLVALDQVDLDMRKGEILAVIGPNGAGKSTLFNVITGVYAPSAGRVWFDGHDITGRPTHEIVARGVARTFQASRLFADLSVLDNVVLGLHTRTRTNVLQALLLPALSRRDLARAAAIAEDILRRLGAICSSSASGRRANSPKPIGAGSKSPGRSRASRSCCCSTNRPREWTITTPTR
jgi:ABC-type branched-subunit amino acid transport system ATPase component